MTQLSSILTPSNLLTAEKPAILTNKTIAFGGNTLTDVASTNTPQALTNKTIDGNSNTLTNVSRFFSTTIEGSSGTSDWTQVTSGDPWIATMTVSGILSSDRPVVDLDLSGVAFADVEDVQADWGLVYRVEASDDDELKFYATEEPTEEFPVQIKVVR